MSDITMCLNKDCPLRHKCYRATAKPDPLWQSYCKYECKDGNATVFGTIGNSSIGAGRPSQSSVEPAPAKIKVCKNVCKYKITNFTR